MALRGRTLAWGSRTFLMGVINVTPDSFSGDGLLGSSGGPSRAADAFVEAAVERARAMAAQGADLLDVGGESSRPGHETVSEAEELRRVVPVVSAIRDALPEMPLSVDTVKRAVAEAALEAGADLINDVAAVGPDDTLARLAAERAVPYIVMHDRPEARYGNLMAEALSELQRALERALALGVAWEALIVDPGIGFGKTPEHNLHLLRHLDALRVLGRPVMVGTSRKSTIGKVLDLPADERLEGTLASTAVAVAAGVDIVRVHDVAPNLRAARMADAIHRSGTIGAHGWEPRSTPAHHE
jgi:dihydropteroate synthase